MAINLPNSPVEGQIYFDTTTGNRYKYNAYFSIWSAFANSSIEGTSNNEVMFNYNGLTDGSNGLIFVANTLHVNNVAVTQNVSATYYYGNGAFLTGVSSGVSDLSPANNWSNTLYSAGLVHANNTANSANAYTVTVGTAANNWANTKQPQENGFLNRNQTILSFDNTRKWINVAPTSGAFTYYHNSANYTVSTTNSVYIANTEGLHYVYYDGPTLKETTLFTSEMITNFALVSACYWDTTQNTAILFVDERHGSTMDSQTHLYNHRTFGTRYGNGLALNNITSGGNGNNNSDAQFGVDGGEIWDEDIQLIIANSASQILTNPAQIPLYYKLGTDGFWRKINSTTFPITTTGSGRAAYNLNNAGTWSLSEVNNNNYVLMHYFATGDIISPIIGIIGQGQYATLAAAQAAASTEIQSLNLTGIASLAPEYLAIATVIFQTSTGYSNPVKSRIVTTGSGSSYVDWRTTKGGGAGSASSLTSWGDIGGTLSNQSDLQLELLTRSNGANGWANTLYYSALASGNNAANSSNVYAVTVGAAANAASDTKDTAGNNYAVSIGTAGNNYAIQVGSASNAWTNTVSSQDKAFANGTANSANAYAVTVGAASNAASDTKDTAGNNFTIAIGASSNAWANTYAAAVGAAANAASDTKDTAGNNYTNQVGAAANAASDTKDTAGNNYTIQVGEAGNNYAVQVGTAGNAYTNLAYHRANTSIQNNSTTLISVGYTLQPWNAGSNVAVYGTWTPNPANGNYQYANSNGTVTIAAPTTDCAIDILFSNGEGGAGNNAKTITFSGFKAPTGGGGDTYSTVANNQYILSIRRINSISTYVWKSLQ